MTQATLTETLNCTPDQLRKAIIDFESYPQHLDGIEKVTIIENNGMRQKVRFELNLIKRFTYCLNMELKELEVSWTFAEGDIFKKNQGGWKLKPTKDGKVEATYTLEIDFKVFVPGMITKKLAGSNMPAMFKQFEAWAKKL